MVYALYEPGMALCFVRPTDDEQAEFVRDSLIHLIEEKAHHFLDETQVERIKTRALKRIKLALTNSKDIAVKLSEAIACGDWRLFFWHRDKLKEVTLAQVRRVLDTYIMPSNRTSGIFKPQKEPKRAVITKAPNAAVVVADIVEDQTLTAGETFIATPKVIEDMVVRTKLSEHQDACVMVKKTRGQSVRANFRVHFGNEQSLLKTVTEFWLIPALLLRGTNKLNYQGIRDRIDALMSNLDIDGHGGLIVAGLKSERQYLKEMLELVVHLFRDAHFSADEFEIVRQREIDNYEEIKNDPQRIGFHELERLKNPWPKDSIHYVHSFDEIIAGLAHLSLHKLKDAYHRLVNLDNVTVGVVGDCAGDEVISELNQLLTRQKSNEVYARVTHPFIKNDVRDLTLDCPDKEMAIVAQAFNFPLRDDHPDFPALKLANYMFGENMNSRLMERIREREGISYGAGSSIEISRHEENASLNIYAMASPDSVKRALSAITEEWQQFMTDGVTEKELATSVESIWLSFSNSLANDGFLVNAFTRDLEIGRTLLWRENLFLRMKELSTKDITTAIQKWWGNAEFSRVTACDLGKIK